MLRSCVIACSRSYFTPKRDRRLVRTHRFSVFLSGVLCVAMLALGFNLLLPLGRGLDTVCV
jgi:hypothetical protein